MNTFESWKLSLSHLEQILGHHFRNRKYLETACTHSSYINEYTESLLVCNERLEFLGDSVFNLIITEYLYITFPEVQEGKLSQLRAALVSAQSCTEFAEKLQLTPFLLVGRGELLNRQKIRTSILADFFEAIIGALYLDAGIEVVKKLIYKNLLPEIRGKLQEPDSNWKAELQEMLQKSKQGMPTYSVLSETGPDHHKCFEVGVFLAKTLLGTGQGSSKKEAEQKAALSALTQLKEKQT